MAALHILLKIDFSPVRPVPFSERYYRSNLVTINEMIKLDWIETLRGELDVQLRPEGREVLSRALCSAAEEIDYRSTAVPIRWDIKL